MIYIFFLLSNILFSSQGDIYLENGLKNKDNLEVAQKYFKKAVNSFVNDNNESGLSDAYYYLGYTYELQSEYSDAIKYYNKSKTFAIKLNNFKNEYKNNERLSIIFKSINIYSKSIYYLNKNNYIVNKYYKNEQYEYRHLYHLANYYFYIKNNQKSLQILSKIRIDSVQNLEWDYLNLFALNYQELGNNVKAEEYYLKLFNLYPEHKIVLANISRFYYSINNIEKSEFYFKKLLNAKVLPNTNDEKVNQLLVSDLYFKLNDTQSALNLLEEITPFFAERNIYDRYLEALILKKDIYYKLEKTKEVQELDSIIYDVKEKQVKAQIDVNSKVIYTLNEIELENLAKEDEVYLYKMFTYASIIILILFSFLIYYVYQHRQIKIVFEDLKDDNDLKFRRTSSLVLYGLNNAINNYVRYMHLNYDFEDNLDLYENFEEIIRVNVDLHKVVKDEDLETPLELNLKSKN